MSVSWVRISKSLEEKKEKRFEELTQRLCRNSLLVILFGSRARGDATPASDYDIRKNY